MANPSAINWMENGSPQQVTQADVNTAKKPILGYVFDLRQKQDICYQGNDFEVIRVLTSGLNRRGAELCEGHFEINEGTITLGPCWMPGIHDDAYTLVLPTCK